MEQMLKVQDNSDLDFFDFPLSLPRELPEPHVSFPSPGKVYIPDPEDRVKIERNPNDEGIPEGFPYDLEKIDSYNSRITYVKKIRRNRYFS